MVALIVLCCAWLAMEASVAVRPTKDERWERIIYAGFPGWLMVGDSGPAEMRGPASYVGMIRFTGSIFIYHGPWVYGLIQWAFSKGNIRYE